MTSFEISAGKQVGREQRIPKEGWKRDSIACSEHIPRDLDAFPTPLIIWSNTASNTAWLELASRFSLGHPAKCSQHLQHLETYVHNHNLNSLRLLHLQHVPVYRTRRHPSTLLQCSEQVPQLPQTRFHRLGLPRWARTHFWVRAPLDLVLVARLPIRSPVLWALRDLRIFLDT